jgi:hypothetical protein
LVQRLLHAGLGRSLADLCSGAVVPAEGDHRPAVVDAGADDVDLVAALRAMFVRPQLAAFGVQRGALDVAVADRELFRQSAGLLHEGIVDRDAAVVMQADHRPGVVVKALCPLLVAAIAEGDEQEALPIEDQARAEVASAVDLGSIRNRTCTSPSVLPFSRARSTSVP